MDWNQLIWDEILKKRVFLTIKSGWIVLLMRGMVLWRHMDLKLLKLTFSTMGSKLFSDRLVGSCVDLKSAYFPTFSVQKQPFLCILKNLKFGVLVEKSDW